MSISPGAGLQFVFDSIFSCLSKEEQLKLIYLFTKLEKDCVVAEREKFNYLCDEFKITTITKQNIIGSIAIKLVILALIGFGFSGMWLGVFADVGVSLIAVLNSLRAMLK